MKWGVVFPLFVVVAIPAATFLALRTLPTLGKLPPSFQGGSSYPPSPQAWHRENVGPNPIGLPRITNVQIVDLNGDGQNEILVCDAGLNSVLAYSLNGQGEWIERVIATGIPAPAHATVVDLDKDGDLDIIVSVLGNIEPDDGVIGKVVWLENVEGEYHPRTILSNVRRVADVQAADFDGDGDVDLVVAVFGYNRGRVLWLENRGDVRFREHELLNRPGTIHVPVADYDGDGDPDIAAIVSQDEEELWVFENLGEGQFEQRLLHQFYNFDIGSAGLIAADLDGDRDVDLILPVGDNLEDNDAYPQPYHGCFWFENLGDWKFQPKRISNLGGTYAAATGDLNEDGDLDVVLVSMSNDWRSSNPASVVWLENDGARNFNSWQIDSTPSHLVTVACGDVDGDGSIDLVAGGLHIRKPHTRVGRVTVWFNKRKSPP